MVLVDLNLFIRRSLMQIKDFEVEIGAMDYDFNLDGIIGLDLLQQLKAIINIDELILTTKR